MTSKILFPALSLLMLLIMAGFFLLNPSYEKSIQAKYYYETSDYKKAYTLAKEAFGEDIYNRMASTIMAQSKISLKYVKYIEEGKAYIQSMNEIATNDTISDSDKARIKLICEIMTSSYVKLAPSVITDKELTDNAAKYNKMFEKLLEKVN